MTIKVTYNVTDVYVTQDVSPVYINVSYSTGSSGGAAVWGGITGTLSDQTDLQTALDGKFDDPTGDTTQYIAGDGSLVAFPITGQAGTLVREVRNVTGATLTKGTVVYINGASGNKPTVAKAIATSDATSAQTFGLIQADIPNNSNGYLVAFGDLDGLNTSAFAEGVQLYLSETTAGGYTSTKQYAPSHLVYIGVVTRQHVNQGRIEVRIQNGYEMDELHDVAAQTPSNNDGLFYNSTNSLWENKSIATALGYTPANSATTLTINGVTYDLSANRTWTVSGGISGSGASGQVAYWTGTSAQSGSNNLFWDSTNGRLGIGTNAPISTFEVVAGSDANGIKLRGRSADNISNFFFASNDGSGQYGYFQHRGAEMRIVNNVGDLSFYNGASTGTTTEKLKLFTTGNLLLQSGGTFTDSGERLQVTGTMKVTGNITAGGQYDNTVGLSYTRISATVNPGYARRILIDQPNSRIQLTQGNSDGNYFLTRENNVSTTTYDSTFGAGSSGGHNGRHLFQCNSVNTFSISGNNGLTIFDGINIVTGTTTGTKIGTSTSEKLSFWNAAPIVQPTTAIAEATFVENFGGSIVNVDSTFAGYTLQQIAQALKNTGLLS